jgi:uncharacterized protein (DUF2236 family)
VTEQLGLCEVPMAAKSTTSRNRRSDAGGAGAQDFPADTPRPEPRPGPSGTTPAAQPLGPDSLTWKYFGDLRTGLLGVWIGAIQNMYPELGAGVTDHSIVLQEPLQRVARSVYPIMGVVYDGDRAPLTGAQIKSYHRDIKGVDAAGRRYHALNPETFYWAHATFFMLILKTAEYFCGGLTEAEKHQLFDEHVRWYRMYGMSMRPVPRTWEEFCEYWDRTCREQLEINQAALDILHIRIPKPWFVLMPTPVWDQLFRPLLAGQRWVAAGVFEPVLREKAGMRWTPGDEVLLRLFGKLVELAFVAVPDEIRLHPRALSAYRRASGRIPADAPLVEAPAFTGPPGDRRGLPMHYVPRRRSLIERAGALVHSTFSLAGLRPARGSAA